MPAVSPLALGLGGVGRKSGRVVHLAWLEETARWDREGLERRSVCGRLRGDTVRLVGASEGDEWASWPVCEECDRMSR